MILNSWLFFVLRCAPTWHPREAPPQKDWSLLWIVSLTLFKTPVAGHESGTRVSFVRKSFSHSKKPQSCFMWYNEGASFSLLLADQTWDCLYFIFPVSVCTIRPFITPKSISKAKSNQEKGLISSDAQEPDLKHFPDLVPSLFLYLFLFSFWSPQTGLREILYHSLPNDFDLVIKGTSLTRQVLTSLVHHGYTNPVLCLTI